MKAVGIIAEYNPFHNGHCYHIKHAKKQSKADVVIVVMSGNFVQRGTPAIIDKWQRTKEAISQGVDLVIELPTVFCVQSADYFGKYAVQLLNKLSVDAIAFGIEKGDVEQYYRILEHEQQYFNYQMNQSYHDNKIQAFQKVLSPVDLELLTTPNNQLALSYLREIKKQNMNIEIIQILRQAVSHTNKSLNQAISFASGTAIRCAVYQKQPINNFVSHQMNNMLSHSNQLSDLTHWFKLLKYKITSETVEELNQYFQMEEGIEYRFKKYIKLANSFEQFVELVKTKRFKKARIQRICLYVILNIKKNNIELIQQKQQQQLRILGATQKGIKFIKSKFNEDDYVTQFKKKHIELFQEQIIFDNIYSLLLPNQAEQNFRRIEL